MLAANSSLAQRLADHFSGRGRLHQSEVVLELDEVEHLASHQVGETSTHVMFRIDHMADPQLMEDPSVGVADRLGPHIWHAETQHQGGGEDARFDVGADAHHDLLELVNRQLAERLLFGGVRDHQVRELAGERLNQL